MGAKLLSDINNAKNKDPGNNLFRKTYYRTITNGFFTVDSKWTVKSWNRASRKIIRSSGKGYNRKKFMGKICRNPSFRILFSLPQGFPASYSISFRGVLGRNGNLV